MVVEAIKNSTGEFTVKDLQDRCPTVGIDLIRKILRNEKKAGRIDCLGRGPDAKWKKVYVLYLIIRY